MDRHIATIAREGLYKTADHVVQLKQANNRDPQSTVDAHVRRLEALRRAGMACVSHPDTQARGHARDITRQGPSFACNDGTCYMLSMHGVHLLTQPRQAAEVTGDHGEGQKLGDRKYVARCQFVRRGEECH